jgi:hypothetical protein
MFQDTLLHAMKCLWIKGSKTLVQDEDSSTLQQRSGNVEPTALAMRKLPTSLTDYLPQPGRHTVEEQPKIQGTTQGFSSLQVCWSRRPAAPHEQVEGQGPGKNIIVVELWHGRYPTPPAGGPERWQIQPP